MLETPTTTTPPRPNPPPTLAPTSSHDWGRPKDHTLEVTNFHLRDDEAAAHEYQRRLLEQKLRSTLNLAPDASDEEVGYAFETQQINMGRARL
jgi:hypothetical protein